MFQIKKNVKKITCVYSLKYKNLLLLFVTKKTKY